MILSVSHSPSARFRRLRNIFGFLPVNDGARAQAPGMDASPDAGPVSGAEISRARRLLQGIESVCVRFPAEVHDALTQAEAAYAKRQWTRHVDRDIDSVLGCSNLSRDEATRSGRRTLAAMKWAGTLCKQHSGRARSVTS